MMRQQKTTLFSYLVYILKNNYLIFMYLFIPMLMNNYQNIAYFIPLIFVPVSMVLVLILPKKIKEINFNERLNKSIVLKSCYLVSQCLLSIVSIMITAYSIGEIFYYKVPLIIFVVATIAVSVFISTSNSNVIINSSTFLFIIAVLLIVVPVFLVNGVKDFTLLKPFYEFKGFSFLVLFYFVFDAISIVLSKTEVDKKVSKWHFLIPLVVMFIFMSIEIFNIIIITGSTYLLNNEFLGFFILFIQDTINYIGNLGLFFLYVIPVVGCFKAGFCLRNIKDNIKFKENVLFNFILGIMLLLIVLLLMHFLVIYNVVFYFILTATILLAVCYFFIIINRSPNYEIYF